MMDEFHAGVTACLRSWSVLRTAVESGWGGGGGSNMKESYSKAEDLRYNILKQFNTTPYYQADAGRGIEQQYQHKQQQHQQQATNRRSQQRYPKISIEDLEDNIFLYMEEEFAVVLEDDSEKQIASTIFQLYETCCIKNDPTFARSLIEQSQRVTNQHYPVQIQSNEYDDDDEDDDDDDDEAMDTTPAYEDEPMRPTCDIMSNAKVGSADTIVPGSVASIPVPMKKCSISAKEYAAEPLFGPSSSTTTRSNDDRRRNKGSVQTTIHEEEELPEDNDDDDEEMKVDDDGFMPVISKGKKNKRRGVKNTCMT